MGHITASYITEMVKSINRTLAERNYTWRLVEHTTCGIPDVKRQPIGKTITWNITPDNHTTRKELYFWLRGFASGLWTGKE